MVITFNMDWAREAKMEMQTKQMANLEIFKTKTCSTLDAAP
jgi:hypothetical protein